jgi:hypothetical protein
MIVEERTYTLQVGKVPEYLSPNEQVRMAIQKRILGNLAVCRTGGWIHISSARPELM